MQDIGMNIVERRGGWPMLGIILCIGCGYINVQFLRLCSKCSCNGFMHFSSVSVIGALMCKPAEVNLWELSVW